MRTRTPLAALICLATGLAVPAPAAPPAIPDSIAYEGLLLDGLGQPLAGPVDLTLRVYDELLAGTLLYKQNFSAVPLNVGVYRITLGPSGAAGDVPTPPLTTSLETALAGDLISIGPDRFVEVTVDSDPPLVRTQLVSAAYALRADRAGTAASADSAAIALDVTSVNGLPAEVVSEMYEHFNFDGGGPANTDPLEGVADQDGDGIANFVDTDNDDDTFPDTQEVDLGLGVNLVTPNLISLSPSTGQANAIFNVHLTGTRFASGMSVQFGGQTPTPVNVTATGADVTVGPQAPGVVSVSVTHPNGQLSPFPRSFSFAPPSFLVTDHLTFDVQGVGNYLIGGTDIYSNSVVNFPFASDEHLAVAWNPAGRLATLRCEDAGSTNCNVRIGQDASGDFLIQPSEEVLVETIVGSTALPGFIRHARLVFDPAGNPVVSYTKFGNANVTVARDTNLDGDYADAGEIRNVASIFGGDPSGDGDLAVDSSGRVALLYFHPVNSKLKLAWDRSGDGDFSDIVGGNSEHFNVLTLSSFQCGGVTFDSAGRAAVVYATPSATVLRRDLNADGDFADAGESTTLATPGTFACDVKGHTTPGLAVTHWDGNGLQLLVDRNGDDDFADTDEAILLAPAAAAPFAPIELARPASGKSSVATRNTVYADPTP